MFTDPIGMSKDGWFEDEEGIVKHDPSINIQKDLDDKNMQGTFIDKSFIGIDDNNRSYDFNENGTISIRSKDAQIDNNTTVIAADRNETVTGEKKISANLAPIIITAVATSQTDSPLPGLAGVFAFGMLYNAITNMFTSTETEQTYTLHFAKSKKGKSSQRKEDVKHTQAGNGKLTGAKKTTHQKRRSGDMGDKKRQKPGWIQR